MSIKQVREAVYGGKKYSVKNAQGVSGVILRKTNSSCYFRVYSESGDFVDYDLIHDELAVTISMEEMASFYTAGELNYLDHSPEVLGLDVK